MSARLFKAGLAMTALAVAGAVIAWVARTPAQATELAPCVLAHADSGTLRDWGYRGATDGALSVGRSAGLSCPQGWQMVVSSTLRKDVGRALEEQAGVYDSPAFRSGIYEATPGPFSSALARQVAMELGAWLEAAHVQRRTAVQCDLAQPEAVAFLEPLDLPFATAVLGVKADIGDPDLAQRTAMQLLARVSMLSARVPGEACLSARKESFLEQARQYQRFSEGAHPWAPGCKAVLDGEDLVLRCSGTGTTSEAR